MLLLLVYFLVFCCSAAVVYTFFGDNSNVEVQKGCGIDLFSQHTAKDRQTLFGPADGERQCDGATAAARFAAADLPANQRAILALLEAHCCVFPAEARHVQVLGHPTKFYEELTRRILAAEHSILMSALYVGDGPLSKGFMHCIERKVQQKIENYEALRAQVPAGADAGFKPFVVNIVLDYNRMQDRHNLTTMRQLLALAHAANAQHGGDGPDARAVIDVRLHLFQNPCRWNRLFAPVGRAKEALGVQHTKLFVFDGRDVIFTGANLSDDYFSTRMDRYVVIERNPHIARWSADLVEVLSRVSHPVVTRDAFARAADGYPPLQQEPTTLLQRVARSLQPPQSPSGSPAQHRRSELVLLPNRCGCDPSTQTAAYAAACQRLLLDFAAAQQQASAAAVAEGFFSAAATAAYDTVLFPSVQFGRAGVFHDSQLVQRVLHQLGARDHLFLTSPYLNMYVNFVEEIIMDKSHLPGAPAAAGAAADGNPMQNCYFDAITASTETNGWKGQKGMAGYIPFFYLQLERAFYYLMKSYGCLDRVHLHEFSAKGLTFHAKGIWLLSRPRAGGPPPGAAAVVEAPYLVAYGSTNYGYRSVHKDVEAEVFLFTLDRELRAALQAELRELLAPSTLVEESRFVRGAAGRFQPVVSLLAQMGQDFL
ncbi:CDP-diacylglycerol--glycerol-3-phosphate 3-phosphatidyltransferase [Strigomonas culicis]|uniref:CDP-diacylglycerol--glycerol-3-phosphate 3-phosphatidyltransferase n=1 Tax=Strigomonas culicis TaxID=28005 RepID=S9TUK2_9TRYP|nr:CDP-diacylglycerol--glycerol-3-phosphate 3-phosphatidyltransferase [Strigomonas culicis]|eukprot:EPY20239.1 CDP-diacylglycerol--glycerol-3-phosphate 3-phosphatidyltransferase [Strigomonas culicis]